MSGYWADCYFSINSRYKKNITSTTNGNRDVFVEQLAQENHQFKEELTCLKDEINRLKDEQG
jgi:hypothetical protein